MKRPYLALVLVTVLLVLSGSAAWEGASFFCVRNDSAIHAFISAHLFDDLANSAHAYPYPHLVHALTHALIARLGCSQWPFFLVQSFFMVVQVLGLFVVGQRLFKEKVAALACVALICGTQAMFGLRTFYLDYPLAAVFIWQYAAYLYSERFTRLKPSLAFLACIPLCLFIKTHYVVYIGALSAGIILDLLPKTRKEAFQLLPLILLPPVLVLLWGVGHHPFTVIVNLLLGSLLLSGALIRACFRSRYRPLVLFLLGTSIVGLLSFGLHQLLCDSHSIDLNYENNVLASQTKSVFNGAATDRSQFPMVQFWQDLRQGMPWATAGQLSSLLLRGHLLEIKCKQLHPLLFWLYLMGLCIACSVPRLRRQTLPMLLCLGLCSFTFLTITTNNARYQAPLLGFRCLLAFFWLDRLKPKFLIFIPGALLWLAGMFLNFGWLGQAAPASDPSYIQNEMLGNHMSHGFLYYNQIPSARGRCRFDFPGSSCTANLLNFKTAWSDNFFFTMPPYSIDYPEFVKKLHDALPVSSSVYVTTYRPPESICNPLGQGDGETRPDLTNQCDLATTFTFFHSLLPPKCPQDKPQQASPDSTAEEHPDIAFNLNNEPRQDCTHLARVHYGLDATPRAMRGYQLVMHWSSGPMEIEVFRRTSAKALVPRHD